jgi:hypothetical protein
MVEVDGRLSKDGRSGEEGGKRYSLNFDGESLSGEEGGKDDSTVREGIDRSEIGDGGGFCGSSATKSSFASPLAMRGRCRPNFRLVPRLSP